jgi:hypothetical protein
MRLKRVLFLFIFYAAIAGGTKGGTKMKKIKRFFMPMLLVCITILGAWSIPAHASAAQGSNNWDLFQYNYEFNSGPDTKSTFGNPTMTDVPGSNPLNDNIRRNKDVAYLPPSYGIFSGELPTNPSSLYHTADAETSDVDCMRPVVSP